MAVPSATAPANPTAGRTSASRLRPSARHASTTRNANQTVAANTRWKLVSGWPPKNCSATSAARPATGSGPGRRITSSVSSISQGMSGKMLVSGHASHTTKKVPNA